MLSPLRVGISALDAGLSSMDKRLPWSLGELDAIPKNGFRVFSVFACAGGSTMGYKRAGFDVVGANDIDQEMAQVYRANHRPGSYFLGSVRDLVSQFCSDGIPEPLRGLDILDGSPPCTPFSMAKGAARENDWGKAKSFREGQSTQVLDDLFFVFLRLVDVLRPRVFVAENVSGLALGKAKGYAKEIVRTAREMGYGVRVMKVNASAHGVPQARERLFFLGVRDQAARPLSIPRQARVATVRDAFVGLPTDGDEPDMAEVKPSTLTARLWAESRPRGRPRYFNHAHPEGKMFSHSRLSWCSPSCTVTASANMLHPSRPRFLSIRELFRLGSFPDDFWLNKKTREQARYVVAMSVPPFMMEDISAAIAGQWL